MHVIGWGLPTRTAYDHDGQCSIMCVIGWGLQTRNVQREGAQQIRESWGNVGAIVGFRRQMFKKGVMSDMLRLAVTELFRNDLYSINPGFGIEVILLVATETNAFTAKQINNDSKTNHQANESTSKLIDW